ncbi:MAG: hypothetical protein N3E52_04015 [Candidatus Bathyarchaeota archaeon]|nr:hypothetical protein [Candidatus Bathyarchaeota archaeon]
MGKRCMVIECPYFAVDGTCLLLESELKENCPAIERVGHEEKDAWMLENTLKVPQGS